MPKGIPVRGESLIGTLKDRAFVRSFFDDPSVGSLAMKTLLSKPWVQAILAFLAWAVIRLWHLTLRVRVIGQDQERKVNHQGKQVIYAFWHGRQFMLFGYPALRPLVQMASLSRDGSLQARILQRLGYTVIRGSSSKQGKEALQAMSLCIRRHHHAALALDGSRGPLHQAKFGAVKLAQTHGACILPLTAQASRAWVFSRSWDRYILPKPFSRVVIALGEPLEVPQQASRDEMESYRRHLETTLMQKSRDVDLLMEK